MVFQNPDSTLNPSFTVGTQIGRPLRRFKTVPGDQVRAEVVRLRDRMKLDERYYDRLPRQLSGGEKQRVGIARAIAGRPGIVAAGGMLKGGAIEISTCVTGVGWVIKGGIAAVAVKAIGERAIKYFEEK